ncbi:MAG: T9SS type A sorting domain-containing protein [bacterium]|nr:T9SS type A sorting domain-containing protein [bacterium]
MVKRSVFVCLLLFGIGVVPVYAQVESRDSDSRTHCVGELLLPVTNYGIFGAIDGNEPSARWPGLTGIDHLRLGALWCGALVSGVPRVSCSANGVDFPMELQAGVSPHSSLPFAIYESAENYNNGDRYPHPNWDFDGDGREDEDPRDGLDNDGDGMYEEDGATISDQMFSCFYKDNIPECYENSPYHQALDLHVYQETYQWSTPLLQDFVGLRFTVLNWGAVEEDFYFGWYADWRILLDDLPGDDSDDRIGFYTGPVELDDGKLIDVHLAYAWEVTGEQASYAGVALLDHPVDPAGIIAPATVGFQGFRIFVADLPYESGGEPWNDSQMFTEMSSHVMTPPDSVADYRTLVSSGPFQVSYRDSLTWQLAIVAGANEAELFKNAAIATQLYQGQAFDRDEDPETGPDGLEHIVHWWPHQILTQVSEHPQRVSALSNFPNPFNPMTEIRFELSESGPVNLSIFDVSGRRVACLLSGANRAVGSHSVTWSGCDDTGNPLAGGVYLARLSAGGVRTEAKMVLMK